MHYGGTSSAVRSCRQAVAVGPGDIELEVGLEPVDSLRGDPGLSAHAGEVVSDLGRGVVEREKLVALVAPVGLLVGLFDRVVSHARQAGFDERGVGRVGITS